MISQDVEEFLLSDDLQDFSAREFKQFDKEWKTSISLAVGRSLTNLAKAFLVK